MLRRPKGLREKACATRLIDSIVVLYIGLALPLGWGANQFVSVMVPNYLVKLLIALGMTPIIYLGHWVVEKYLGHTVAEALAADAARQRGALVSPFADSTRPDTGAPRHS